MMGQISSGTVWIRTSGHYHNANFFEGLDGVPKMSKSYGNYIGLWGTGKWRLTANLMSIFRWLMWRYYSLLVVKNRWREVKNAKGWIYKPEQLHPMNLKKEMASGIIARFWSSKEKQKTHRNIWSFISEQRLSKATEVDANILTRLIQSGIVI